MKNVSPSARRIFGVIIAMIAGTLATFVLASPASAHYTSVYGESVCDSATGTFKVTWTVKNSEQSLSASLIKVVLTPAGTTAAPIVEGATLPDHQGTNTGKLVGIQTVPGNATEATLAVRGHWTDDFEDGEDRGNKVTFGKPCVQDQPIPTATFSSVCDGTVKVTLANDAAAKVSAAFTITAGAFTNSTSVAPGAPAVVVTVPAASAANIAVTVAGKGNVGNYSWSRPADCAPVKVSPKSDCTTLSISLENPAGNTPIDATVTSGNTEKKVKIAGGTTETVSFPASAGTSATVTFGAGAAAAAKVAPAAAAAATQPTTYTWASPGAECTPTSAPGLPVTGAKLGPVIGAGVALIALGAGLLLFLRRRRTTTPTTPAQ